MIDLVYIAKAINDLLGENYKVIPNANVGVSIDGKQKVTLTATRTPFSIKEIDSESAQIYLETLLCVDNPIQRDKGVEGLRKITGYKSVSIDTQDGENYVIALYLDLDAPTASPYISAGKYYQRHTLSGTALISNSKTGGLIASQVLTKLTLHDAEEDKDYTAFVPVTAAETSLIFSTENAPCGSDNVFEPKQSGRGRTYAINCVFLNRDFDMKLIKIFNSDFDFAINQDITLEKFFDSNLSFKTTCRIIDGKLQEQAGQFLSYSLTLQEVQSEEVVI